jgi:hypothetical protein
MANESNDRERMRNDLRELAKLAKPESSPASHRFETADSSGYVDLSAFSATDSSWVDRELARAKSGSPPPLPKGAKARAIDALSPESMAPVSIESFLAPEETARTRIPRARRALYAVLALASVAGVAALAFVVSRHAPPPSPAKDRVAVAAVAPPPAETAAASAQTPSAQPAAETVPTPPAETAARTAAATPASPAAQAASSSPAAKKKAVATSQAHAAAPAAAPPRAAAPSAAKPVTIPTSHTKSSGDSLMDAIRSSVAKGK